MIFEKDKIINLPILPLKGLVVFPFISLNLDSSREKSINAINYAMEHDQLIFLVTQIDPTVEVPQLDDLYQIGCFARIRQINTLPNNVVRIFIESIERGKLLTSFDKGNFIMGEVLTITSPNPKRYTKLHDALIRNVIELYEKYFSSQNQVSAKALISKNLIGSDIQQFSFVLASYLNVPYDLKQELLEINSGTKRIESIIKMLTGELELLEIEKRIEQKVREQINENQKEYFLREQLKVISEELGAKEDIETEVDEYTQKLHSLNLEEELYDKINKEILRLYKMPPGSHEATVVRTYLDTVLELPFNKTTKDNLDLKRCENVLNRDHYGLYDIKTRIIEYLAVKKHAPHGKTTVICLVGPPGVGKTSIATSVAGAIGRKFSRISLGSIRDEADIRGHRKTYIGAMPGRIINAIKNAGSKNPVILLDEIDKMSMDYKGDPSAALLEVLDKEQNYSFRDHYLEIPFDLSDVMFITTANSLSTIPSPLLDRMEVIELSSYTRDEKFHIANKYLYPKQLKEHGVSKSQISIDKTALYEIIDHYVAEAGVRNLEREIAKLIRKALCFIDTNELKSIKINKNRVCEFLGIRKYIDSIETNQDKVGLVNGLAYTSYGGTMLNVEVNVLDGTGKVELTGKLGDVMKESARAAISYIRSKHEEYGISKNFYKNKDIHIHVPEGATPKDGPSAGITMAVGAISALTDKKVRGDIAMTGEVTIRGRVLPIGGLKEKALAAHREKITNIIIPYDNIKDISDIPEHIRDEFNFIPVKTMDEVVKNAIVRW